MDHFPYNVHLVSAADKIGTHEGKGDTQEQLVVDQEFESYGSEKNKEDYDEKGVISRGSMLWPVFFFASQACNLALSPHEIVNNATNFYGHNVRIMGTSWPQS